VTLAGIPRQPFSQPGQFLLDLRAGADPVQLRLELFVAQRSRSAVPGIRCHQLIGPRRLCLQVSFFVRGTAGGHVGVCHVRAEIPAKISAMPAWARARCRRP
jgi:hypothetical protein